MTSRLGISLRILLAIALGTIVVILILRYGDQSVPEAAPSHLYQPGNPAWPAAIIWWSSAGAAAGILAGFVALRVKGSTVGFSLAALFLIDVCVGFILSGVWLHTTGPLMFSDLLKLGAINSFYFIAVSTVPAVLGLFAGSLTAGAVDAVIDRRSALEIMPDELREKYEHDHPKHHGIGQN